MRGSSSRSDWSRLAAIPVLLACGLALAGCEGTPSFDEAKGLPFKPTAHVLVASGDMQPSRTALFLACDPDRRPRAVIVASLPLTPDGKTIGLQDDALILVDVDGPSRERAATLGRLQLTLVSAGRRETLLSPPLTEDQRQMLEAAVLSPGPRARFNLSGFAETGLPFKADPQGYATRKASFDCGAP